MKIFALAVLLAIMLGGLVGTLMVRDPGYVLIAYADTALETSLWVAVLLLIGFYLALRGLSFVVRRLARGHIQVSRWRSGRKLRAARSETVRGLLVMAEGRWADAKKLLLESADDVETPLINYLNAARAAHELGELAERDEYLKKAHETTSGAKFAVSITQAEFNIHEGRYEQALATLLNLHRRAPKNGAVLAMLAKCYEALSDWQALLELLGALRKHKALSETELLRLERTSWAAQLSASDSDASLWKRLPKSMRADLALMQQWIRQLVADKKYDDAEQIIRQVLAQQWDAELAQCYGEIRGSDPARQMVVAQGWAKARPNDAEVALTLGRLCLMNEKFEQARDYFEQSLRLNPTDTVYGELGRLCVALGDERRGTEYLLRSLGNLTDLPQPSEPTLRKTSVSSL